MVVLQFWGKSFCALQTDFFLIGSTPKPLDECLLLGQIATVEMQMVCTNCNLPIRNQKWTDYKKDLLLIIWKIGWLKQ